jgi:hypothetical protein
MSWTGDGWMLCADADQTVVLIHEDCDRRVAEHPWASLGSVMRIAQSHRCPEPTDTDQQHRAHAEKGNVT